MGESHDTMATYCGNYILNKIREGDPDYKQIFSTDIIRSADWDWPRPDFVCYDENLKSSYALEFKPPSQNKREYLTGVGQSLSYLQKHSYAGLIVPYLADDGFRIADFICNTLNMPEFREVPHSLYAYNPNNGEVKLLKAVKTTRAEIALPGVGKAQAQTFWCWWRDLSHYELYDLLNLSFIYSDYGGDIYTDFIYPKFYDMMIKGQTKQWDGTPRNKNSTKAYEKEKQNYKIPLSQLELWNSSDGKLTDLGFRLLEIGKKYGPNSKTFIDTLAYLILVNGKHLDLIHIFKNFQQGAIPKKSADYKLKVEEYLTSLGCIGKRKPGAVTTNAKGSYIRDEPKLWNKLGLLETQKKNYFISNVGYNFNWERITNILKEVAPLLK